MHSFRGTSTTSALSNQSDANKADVKVESILADFQHFENSLTILVADPSKTSNNQVFVLRVIVIWVNTGRTYSTGYFNAFLKFNKRDVVMFLACDVLRISKHILKSNESRQTIFKDVN